MISLHAADGKWEQKMLVSGFRILDVLDLILNPNDVILLIQHVIPIDCLVLHALAWNVLFLPSVGKANRSPCCQHQKLTNKKKSRLDLLFCIDSSS